MALDPTYVKTEIAANPEWDLAWVLSEIMNDNAPIGWGKYIWVATCLLGAFEIKRKSKECFCGTELEAGLCPNGHDPVASLTGRNI